MLLPAGAVPVLIAPKLLPNDETAAGAVEVPIPVPYVDRLACPVLCDPVVPTVVCAQPCAENNMASPAKSKGFLRGCISPSFLHS